MPDFHDSWVSAGIRHNYSVECNCAPGGGQAQCLADCEAEFDADVAALKESHPPD